MKNNRIQNLKEPTALFIIKRLSEGFTEKEIAEELKSIDMKPSSIVSVELYIKVLRKRNNCKTTFQLMYLIGKGMKLTINI